jgi:hypothetical protein
MQGSGTLVVTAGQWHTGSNSSCGKLGCSLAVVFALLCQVGSYMRAVLRTLAQCHHARILHRDIKPGNFMLLTEAEDAPLKAIGEREPHTGEHQELLLLLLQDQQQHVLQQVPLRLPGAATRTAAGGVEKHAQQQQELQQHYYLQPTLSYIPVDSVS